MRRALLFLVELYPSGWRARYGEELVALLEECPLSGWTALDLLLCAAEAHVSSARGRLDAMIIRVRNSAMAVFAAWVVYVLAGLVLYGVLDDNPLTDLARTTYPGLRLAVLGVQAGAVLALVAVAAGVLPIGFTVVRKALAERRRDLLALLAVPVVCSGLITLYLGVLVLVAHQQSAAGYPASTGRPLLYGFQLVVLASVVVSALAILTVFVRSQIGDELLHAVRLPAALAALAMGLTWLAVMAWGWQAWSAAPQVFRSAEGLFGVATAVCWGVVAVVMAAASLAAGLSARRSFAA